MYTKENGIVSFTYDKDKMFDRVSLQTTYMTKNMTTKEGINISEDYAQSDDERDAFDLKVETVMSDIYDHFLRQTKEIANSLLVSDTELVIKINDYEAYNENVLTQVDQAISECILYGCVKEWFEVISQGELLGLSEKNYVLRMEKLKKRIFQLKKKRAFS